MRFLIVFSAVVCHVLIIPGGLKIGCVVRCGTDWNSFQWKVSLSCARLTYITVGTGQNVCLLLGFLLWGCYRIFYVLHKSHLENMWPAPPEIWPLRNLVKDGFSTRTSSRQLTYPVAMAPTCLCLLKKHWSWLKKEQHTLRPAQEDETQVASKEPDMPTPCSLAVSKHLPREIHGGPQLKQPSKVG